MPRASFTRSRSPAVHQIAGNGTTPSYRVGSPAQLAQFKSGVNRRNIFPPVFQVSMRLPLSQTVRRVSIDSSKACEVVLLLGSLGYIATVLSASESERWTSIGMTTCFSPDTLLMPVTELSIVVLLSLFYTIWSHYSTTKIISHPAPPAQQPPRESSPRSFEARRQTTILYPKRDFGFVWMTVPKNYRQAHVLDHTIGIALTSLSEIPPTMVSSLPCYWDPSLLPLNCTYR